MIKGKLTDSVSTALNARPLTYDGLTSSGRFLIQCHRDGKLLWTEEGPNLIVNAGLTYLNGVALTSVAQITTWYLGLVSSTPTIAAGDTMSSHAGWTEVATYDEAARQTWTGVAGSAGVSTNSASPAVFTISGTVTVGGVFLTSVSTKSGTTGTLFSAKAFSSDRALVDNDTLTVTYQVSNTSS